MIIGLEGIDCSGKTTTGKLLAGHGFKYYQTPPGCLAEKRREVDRFSTDDEHYQFYLEVVRVASDELRTTTGDVAVDRYWLTTKVYHRVMGVEVHASHFEGILLPDLTVYLEVDLATQAERFRARGMSPGDLRMLTRMRALQEVYEEELRSATNVLRINTTIHRPERVVNAILEHARGARVA